MREIKFRAYIKSLGWIVNVERINFDCKTVEVDLTEGQGDTAEYDFKEIELLRYTGLKDINGEEIYEGDICRQKDVKKFGEHTYVVEWHNNGWFSYTEKDTSKREEYYYNLGLFTVEIIGNIYENPELLKESEA